MIKTITHGITYYSKLNYPHARALMEQSMSCNGEVSRIGNNLNLKIIVSFLMKNIYTNEDHEILKSQTSYIIETDGVLDITNLYSVYEHAMLTLILGLNQLEDKNGIPRTTNLHPIPLEFLRKDLSPIVNDFLG